MEEVRSELQTEIATIEPSGSSGGNPTSPPARKAAGTRRAKQTTGPKTCRLNTRAWYTACPERLEYELEALRAAGYDPRIDEDARAQGQLKLGLLYSAEGREYNLEVVFPDNYPYFPFSIFCKSFPEGIHKEPFTGNLCFLANPLSEWESDPEIKSTVGTVAKVLEHQLPIIHKAHTDPEAGDNFEAQEGYQPSGQLPYMAGAVVFTPEWDDQSNVRRGQLLLAREQNNPPDAVLRAAAVEIQDENGENIATFPSNFCKRFSPRPFPGRWVELDAPPGSANPNELINQAAKTWPALASPKYPGGPDVLGLRFPEESAKGTRVWNWVFVVRQKIREKRQSRIETYLVRADRTTLENTQVRVPRLRGLSRKRALIVGAGSIGSTLAWQLARSGVNVNILDGDHVESGNLPRWLLGFPTTGYPKAYVLCQHLAHQYPFIEVKGIPHRIGVTYISNNNENEDDILKRYIAEADVVIDATAEFCVSHYLSDCAAECAVPYIWATSTHGAWGGIIGRVRPQIPDECWSCFQLGLGKHYPEPPAEPSDEVQPVGCFQSTFPGTGFDLDQIAIGAARLAVSTLCADDPAAYPDMNLSGAVLSLFESDGTPCLPRWESFSITRHANCQKHRQEAATP